MARMTKADKLSRNNEEEALGFFEQMLGELRDPRRPQGRRNPLRTVVVTALMALVCGSDDADAFGSVRPSPQAARPPIREKGVRSCEH